MKPNRKKERRYLIARIDRIGDVVTSTPLPREIKRAEPESFVAVLVRAYTKDIYLNNPYVDQIIIYKEKEGEKDNSFDEMVKEISSYSFTHGFMILPDIRLNIILFKAGIPYRVGVGHKLYQFLTFTKYVNRHKLNPIRHESDYSLDMLRKIGIEPVSLEPEIHLTDEEKIRSGKIREELLGDKKFLIGVNTTSGNSSPNWKPEKYIDLIKKLIMLDDFKIVVTDFNPPDEIKELDSIVFLCEEQLLRESIIILNALDLLISSSTGPMHIAAALKVKTLSMFCPLTGNSPKLWGPIGNDPVIVLPEENYCQVKCPGDPKICDFSGEGGISVEKVYSEFQKIFNHSR